LRRGTCAPDAVSAKSASPCCLAPSLGSPAQAACLTVCGKHLLSGSQPSHPGAFKFPSRWTAFLTPPRSAARWGFAISSTANTKLIGVSSRGSVDRSISSARRWPSQGLRSRQRAAGWKKPACPQNAARASGAKGRLFPVDQRFWEILSRPASGHNRWHPPRCRSVLIVRRYPAPHICQGDKPPKYPSPRHWWQQRARLGSPGACQAEAMVTTGFGNFRHFLHLVVGLALHGPCGPRLVCEGRPAEENALDLAQHWHRATELTS
jgi:hypothetical protein